MISLNIYTELRDLIYGYVGPVVDPIDRSSVRPKHEPWPNADSFTGFVLVCRQIYEEYHSHNPHAKPLSNHVTLRMPDVNNYTLTFFHSTKDVEKVEQITVKRYFQWPRKGMAIPMVNLVPLLRWSFGTPKPSVVFEMECLRDLTALIDLYPVKESSISKKMESLDRNTNIKSDPTPEETSAFIRAIDSIWIRHQDPGFGGEELLFLFNPSYAASWMDMGSTYTSNIRSITEDVDADLIPEDYFSEDEKQRICFWKCMGLNRWPSRWIIGLGVGGQYGTGSSQLDRQDSGWVWSEEEEEEKERKKNSQVDDGEEDDEEDDEDESEEEEESESEEGWDFDRKSYDPNLSSEGEDVEMGASYHSGQRTGGVMASDLDDACDTEEEDLEYLHNEDDIAKELAEELDGLRKQMSTSY